MSNADRQTPTTRRKAIPLPEEGKTSASHVRTTPRTGEAHGRLGAGAGQEGHVRRKSPTRPLPEKQNEDFYGNVILPSPTELPPQGNGGDRTSQVNS